VTKYQSWVTLIALAILGGAAAAAPRTNEVGIVRYLDRYTFADSAKGRERGVKNAADAIYARIKEIGLTPEWVDPDIFMEQRRGERDRFKRIVIPSAGEWYSRAIHEGMNDYVQNGGLLVVNMSLVCEDNGDYVIGSKGGATTKYPGDTFLGVFGHATANMTRIKAVAANALTRGLTVDEWITLEETMGGRKTRNISAEVVVISDHQTKTGKTVEQPFLTFKHQNKGACIYLVGQVGALTDKTVRQIFRNIFSNETREWLCLQ